MCNKFRNDSTDCTRKRGAALLRLRGGAAEFGGAGQGVGQVIGEAVPGGQHLPDPGGHVPGELARGVRPLAGRTLTSMPSTIASICGPTAENPATLSASVTACAKTALSTAVRSDSSVTSSCVIRRHPGVSRWRIRSCPSASSSVGSRGPVSFPISSW